MNSRRARRRRNRNSVNLAGFGQGQYGAMEDQLPGGGPGPNPIIGGGGGHGGGGGGMGGGYKQFKNHFFGNPNKGTSGALFSAQRGGPGELLAAMQGGGIPMHWLQKAGYQNKFGSQYPAPGKNWDGWNQPLTNPGASMGGQFGGIGQMFRGK